MKKHISLILLPILSVAATPVATTFTSCSKNSNITYKFDDHVKGYSASKWQAYEDFTLECNIEDGWQISEATFYIEGKGYMDEQDITITKDKVVVAQKHITDSQKVTVTINCSQVIQIPVTINSEKFVVKQTSFNFNSNEDLRITPTSRTYDGQLVHNVNTIHGNFNLLKSGSVVERIQFKSGENGVYTLPVNKFARKLKANEFDSVSVDLKFAQVNFSKPWEVFASIANKTDGKDIAKQYFNYGDYASISFAKTYMGFHYVRIVDIGADTVTSGGEATFTFEFANPIANRNASSTYYTQTVKWSGSLNKDYSESNVHSTINSEDTSGFLTYLKEALGDSASCLKTVTRNCLYTTDVVNPVYTNKSFTTTVFLPGLKNIMSNIGIEKWTKVESTKIQEFEAEQNQQYQFYKNEVGDNTISTAIKNNIHARKYSIVEDDRYLPTWIGTPDVTNIYRAMTFNTMTSDNEYAYSSCNGTVAYAPCFCF